MNEPTNNNNVVTSARLIAHYISRIIPELTLINFSDYVSYIEERKIANIREIIDASTELHFAPNCIKFNNFAEYNLDWSQHPELRLGLIFENMNIKINFILTLSKSNFSINIQSADFPKNFMDNDFCNEKLQQALNHALHKKIKN